MIIVAAYDGSYKDNRKRQYLSKTSLDPPRQKRDPIKFYPQYGRWWVLAAFRDQTACTRIARNGITYIVTTVQGLEQGSSNN
jgi:hypothetical protein